MTNKRKRERVRNAQKRDTKNNAKHKIIKHVALEIDYAAPMIAPILVASTLLPCVKHYQLMILEKILLGRRLVPYVNRKRNNINI